MEHILGLNHNPECPDVPFRRGGTKPACVIAAEYEETQKNKIIHGANPRYIWVDEFPEFQKAGLK